MFCPVRAEGDDILSLSAARPRCSSACGFSRSVAQGLPREGLASGRSQPALPGPSRRRAASVLWVFAGGLGPSRASPPGTLMPEPPRRGRSPSPGVPDAGGQEAGPGTPPGTALFPDEPPRVGSAFTCVCVWYTCVRVYACVWVCVYMVICVYRVCSCEYETRSSFLRYNLLIIALFSIRRAVNPLLPTLYMTLEMCADTEP